MGTLVEHGPKAHGGSQMHPFFQPTPHSRQAPLPHPEPHASPIHDVDPCEDSLEKGTSTPSSHPEGSSPSTATTVPQVHAHENADIDPNQVRRKRRRLTPSSDLVSGCEPDHDPGSLRGDMHAIPLGQDSMGVNFEEVELPSGSREVNAAAQSRRRSVRVSSSQISGHGSSTPAKQLTINLSPRKPEQQPMEPLVESRTPQKKKMLHLSSNGKLVKSPNKSPGQKRGTKAAVGSSKNLSIKGGRIVSSLKVVIPYSKASAGEEPSTGVRIEQLLSGELRIDHPLPCVQNNATATGKDVGPRKSTHPFFLGKAALPPRSDGNLRGSDETSTAHNSDAEVAVEIAKPKAWSEIKFNSSRSGMPKDVATFPAPWPTLGLQDHAHPLPEVLLACNISSNVRRSKQKQETSRVPKEEDILHHFAQMLHVSGPHRSEVTIPEKCVLRPTELLEAVDKQRCQVSPPGSSQTALRGIKQRALLSRGAFDRGQAAGPWDWAHQYAPRKAEDVLQSRCHVLADWLKRMKVHHVQSKLAPTNHDPLVKVARRRGRPKRKQDNMDDFMVSSDDESVTSAVPLKNAMLICGPHGCGKTASIYAAAAELDFEVFEIHPGMRRSAKDIFDKVGDMTHNHLVQRAAPLSRESSELTEDADHAMQVDEVGTGKQQSMADFIKKPRSKRGKQNDTDSATQHDRPSVQKQSVILLEEVDIIFEDDKTFWPGVQALIQQSKRPIVMTCNSLESIPVEDLPLQAVLTYERPCEESVIEYLSYVAAAQGHILDREALSTLYNSRGQDLRATLMDLNFWCQMTVGSKVGGLDWIPSSTHSSRLLPQDLPRVISCGTFHRALNLIPEQPSVPEEVLSYYQEQLGVPVLEWEAYRGLEPLQHGNVPPLTMLDDAVNLCDARSCMDIQGSCDAPRLSDCVSKARSRSDITMDMEAIIRLVSQKPDRHKTISRKIIAKPLAPVMDDLRTFPPPTGRTAPSIDGAEVSIVNEVAPYVRTIVSFDQRLEQQRLEMSGGPQAKKQRTTRAARAALEGGEKSNTRRERWFPKDLDFDVVLDTSPGWPLYREDDDALTLEFESSMET